MKADISTLISSLSENQLRKILIKYAQIHEDIREEILSFPALKAKKYDELSVQEWKRRIKDAVEEDLVGEMDDYYPNKYVNWENTVRKTTEAIDDLIGRGLNQECLDLLTEVEESITVNSERDFETAEEGYDIYVEYDGSWIDEFEKLRCKAAGGSVELKESLFDDYCRRAEEGDLVPEWLTGFNTLRDKAVQLEIILRYLKKHRAQLNDYTTAQYAAAAFDLQKSLNPEKIEEFFQEFKKSRALRKRMDSFYEENGRIDSSIRLLTEDLQKDPLSSDKSDRLISLYISEGNKPAAEQELKRRLERNIDVKLPMLEQFYDLADQKARDEVSSLIIDGKYEDFLKIAACKELGRLEDLKSLLTAAANLFRFNDWRYRSFLADYIYPSDQFITEHDEAFIPDLLLNMVEQNVQSPKKREEYQIMVSFLKYLCSGTPSRKAMAVQFASNLLHKYKKRRAMQEIFNENGFT